MVQITKGGRANRAGRSVRKTSASVRNRKTRPGRPRRPLEVLSCWPGRLDGDPILSVIRSLRQRRPFYGTYELMPEANSTDSHWRYDQCSSIRTEGVGAGGKIG